MAFLVGCGSLGTKSGKTVFREDGVRIVRQNVQLRGSEGQSYAVESYVLMPEPQRKGEHFPLLLALHGRGGNGRAYLEIWRKEASQRRWMILAPSYENPDFDLDAIDALLIQVKRDYPVDSARIYLEGVSAGGFISQLLVKQNPSAWKAAVFVAAPPFEAPGHQTSAGYPPLLFVHGEKDAQFRFEDVLTRVGALKKEGIEAEVFRYPDAAHEHRPEWNGAIFDWLERH